MVDPVDGSYDGSLPDYYSSADYTDGSSVDTATNQPYSSSYGNNDLIYYNGSSWTAYDSPGNRNMGVAIGWDKIFIVRTDPYFEIMVYGLTSQALEETITLNGWSSYLMGLSCGREDAVGSNESVFIATFYPSSSIYEVEVGDYTGVGIKTASLGTIKAVYK